MALKTVCDDCDEVIDSRHHYYKGKDLCDDCYPTQKLIAGALKPFLCAACIAEKGDECEQVSCNGCSRMVRECVFIDRLEGQRCPFCCHSLDLKLAKTDCMTDDCGLCTEITERTL